MKGDLSESFYHFTVFFAEEGILSSYALGSYVNRSDI